MSYGKSLPPPVIAEVPFQAKVVDTPWGMWRMGNTLVLRNGARLPPRCLKSGERTKAIWRRTLSWHPPWVIALILVAVPVYIVVAIILTKRATFDFPISDPWRARRRNAMLVGWGLALVGVVTFIAGCVVAGRNSMEEIGGILILASLPLPIIGAIWGIFRGRLLWPQQIDDNFTWVNGVSPAYLAELPPWPGEYDAFRHTAQTATRW
jgi:hypothetical protein